jgi:hypothetical protein
MLWYTCIASLIYRAMYPSFIKILKYTYNNLALNYLLYHKLSIPVSQVIIVPVINFGNKF